MQDIVKVEGLIEINKSDVIEVFCDDNKLSGFIDIIKNEVTVSNFSLSTDKGRKEIAGRAHKVSKIKTALTKLLDNSLDEKKSLIKTATNGKKFLASELDDLRNATRQPLTEWEAAEKIKEEKRVNEIEVRIQGILNLGNLPENPERDYIAEMIEAVDNIDCSECFDEFTQDALQAQSTVKQNLSSALHQIIQKELEEKQRIEFDKQKKELEEKQRVADLKRKIEDRLCSLRMIPVNLLGQPSVDIKAKIDSLTNYEIDSNNFGDLYDEATETVAIVIDHLITMFDQQKLVEESQKQKEAEILARQAEESPVIETEITPPVSQHEPSLSVILEVEAEKTNKTSIELFAFMSSECVTDIIEWGKKNKITDIALGQLDHILIKHYNSEG